MKAFVLAAAVLAAFSPAVDAAKRPRRGKPRKAAVAEPAREPTAAAEREALPAPSLLPKKPAEASPQPSAPDAPEGLAGLAVRPDGGALRIEGAAAYGALAALRLAAGDLATHAGGARLDAEGDLRSALRAWRPGERFWSVVLRDGLPVGLETPFVPPLAAGARGADALTAREEAAREANLEAARTGSPLAALSYPSLSVPAGEKLWLKFPSGLPASLRAGDVVTAETAAPLAADKRLDYLAVPPGSKVWLSALSVRDEGPVRAVRLHAFKVALAGGRVYAFSALPCAIAGSGAYARVTPGGTLVTAPGEDAKVSLGPEWTVQVRLLEALTLSEPEAFYRAGPGLWVKEVMEGSVRGLEVTLVVAGRSADRAGIKAGDRVQSINGTSSSRLGFAAALNALYGQPGSEVTLRLVRRGEARPDTFKLQRGASWRRGYGLRLRREGDVILAQEASPGSPAAAAGVKPGLRLLRIDAKAAADLDRAALRAMLEGDEEGALEFVFAGEDGKERPQKLSRAWYPSIVKVDAKPAPYGPAAAD